MTDIKSNYQIKPAQNGFILIPIVERGLYIGDGDTYVGDTYVFETAEKLGEFIAKNFKPVGETKNDKR